MTHDRSIVDVQEMQPVGALKHQFDDLEQQDQADELGMWIFLSSEVMFFGGLFLAYSTYRYLYPAAFYGAAQSMDVFLGTLNTGLLLTSSMTMAIAVHLAEKPKGRGVNWLLVATALFGVAFLCIKGYEYYEKFEHGLAPMLGLPFRYDGPDRAHAEIFFDLYFVMTGLHAVHLLLGIGAIGVLLLFTMRGRWRGEASQPVHLVGLYWHFVDIVWVFLYPFFYLIESGGS